MPDDDGPMCFICFARGEPMTGDAVLGTSACLDEEGCYQRAAAFTEDVLATAPGASR